MEIKSYLILVILLIYGLHTYFAYRLSRRRERKLKEEYEQLLESNLHFLTDISHEIRSSLTLIITPLEKVLDMKADDVMQASFDAMRQNSIRIINRLERLTDLKAAVDGTLRQPIEPVNASGSVIPDNRKRKEKKKRQESVLIVEDDMDILRYIESELNEEYHVYTALDGKDGLTKALQYLPDIIVSDIVMPEMDGLRLCKLIKKNINTCHIPVILLTAKTNMEQRIEGLEMGADSYITKPFNIKYLHTRIEKLIQSRETLRLKYTGKLDVVEDDIKVVTSNEKLLKRFNDKLKEHIENPDLNVDFISNELGISRVHLNRRLKEIIKDSPSNYIRNYRLKHAGWLLINKDMSIAETAYAVGFSSQAHFSVVFKKQYGMSPTEYMEMNRKTGE